MKSLDEIDAWNKRIESVRTSKEMYAILVELSEMLKTGKYPYDNTTLEAFFDGLAGAIYSEDDFDHEPPNVNFWNHFAALISMGTVYD